MFLKKTANGSNTFFWKDAWCKEGIRLKDLFPRLFALENNKDCLIVDRWKLINGTWRAVWDWRINHRGRALDDLTNLSSIIGDLSLSPGTNDKWLWSCDATGVFKVRSITSLIQNKLLEYCKLDNHLLWNSWIPRKVNICVWRASLNRLPSRLNLQNRGVALSSILCPLCEDELSLQETFPRLFALEEDKEVSVASKLGSSSVDSSFRRLIRDGIERQQWSDLSSLLESVILSPSKDRWFCDLNGEGAFRVKDARSIIDDIFLPSSEVATRWVKYIPIKINIFMWRARLDRIPTRCNLASRGVVLESSLCPLCGLAPEDASHVLFRCELSKHVFRRICRWWDLDWQDVSSFPDWDGWFANVRLPYKLKLLLEGVFCAAWWHIWIFRNHSIFDKTPPRCSILFDDIVAWCFTWCGSRSEELKEMLKEGVMGGNLYWVKNDDEAKFEGIVVVFIWGLVKDFDVKDYVDLYSSIGWNSLVVFSDFLNPFFPERATSLAFSVINELLEELRARPCPLVLTSFSGGSQACMYKVFQIIEGTCEAHLSL
ncbi:RNA-directed DNA polymerase, eukaryota, partial [Tanacetum coccineum]